MHGSFTSMIEISKTNENSVQIVTFVIFLTVLVRFVSENTVKIDEEGPILNLFQSLQMNPLFKVLMSAKLIPSQCLIDNVSC